MWKRSPQGPPIYIVEVQCNSRRARGAELDSCCCKQEEPLQRVAWGWCIYNIVESESDPLTRRAVDLFEKEPLKGNSEVHLHTPTKFGEDPSKDLGGDREQTDRQTNRQTDKRCSIYSMIFTSLRNICFIRNLWAVLRGKTCSWPKWLTTSFSQQCSTYKVILI